MIETIGGKSRLKGSRGGAASRGCVELRVDGPHFHTRLGGVPEPGPAPPGPPPSRSTRGDSRMAPQARWHGWVVRCVAAAVAVSLPLIAQATPATERVSVDSGGQEGNYFSVAPALSGNGSLVAFMSVATNLVPDD